jgi:hypothetical protein
VSVRTLVAALACFAGVAHAATFVVTNTNDSDAGSLRQAILDSNADADPDENVIEFALGNGAKTIQPASPLPAVTQAVTIDGSTQPDWTGAPLITIDGTNVAAGQSGLILSNHTGSTVIGLAIGGFIDSLQTGGNGLLIDGGGGHTIRGSWFGSDPTGSGALPNRYGIACVGCSGCTIGDPGSSTPRNVLSGNNDAGILLRDATNTVIQRNWIGLGSDGTTIVTNGLAGIFMLSSNAGSTGNVIGGDTSDLGNVISGNTSGVSIGSETTSGTIVRNNLIGTDASGTVVLGNSGQGININGAPSTRIDRNVIVGSSNYGIRIFNSGADGTRITDNTIGTDAAGVEAMPNGTGIRVQNGASGAPQDTRIQGNVIAHNTGAGVEVVSGFAGNVGMIVSPIGVEVTRNSIYANGGLAIDLEADGLTPNDFHDEDDGANHLQNFPIVTSVVDLGGAVEFEVILHAAPNTGYHIELFESATADPSGFGEAERWLGNVDPPVVVVTDEDGHGKSLYVLGVTVTPGAFITATATAIGGQFGGDHSTSEMGPAFLVPDGATSSSTSTSTSTTDTTTSSTSTSSTTSTSTAPTTSSSTAGTTTSSSSTTVADTTTTSSSTSTIAPGTSSSTTTTPITSTTTTTGTGVPTCPPTPFHALLACDVERLQGAVEGGVAIEPIRTKLLKRLGTAATSVTKASTACSARRTGPAKKALGKLNKALGQCAKMLRSKKARTLPESLRTALGDLIAGAQSDVAIVKSGIVCP